MADRQQIGEMIRPPEYLAQATEEVGQLRAQFDVEAIRSMIVVDDSGPVGVIRRRDIENLEDDQRTQPVREFMMPVPVLRDTMSVDEARSAIAATDYTADRIPVVNAEGQLVGELSRGTFMEQATTSTEKSAKVRAGSMDTPETIEEGMVVRSVDGKKLGEVDQILVREGELSAIRVKHGLFGRNHKRLPADVVKSIDSKGVTLAIGEMEFKQLADVEELKPEMT